jgi:AcrR family transcriptional regulator
LISIKHWNDLTEAMDINRPSLYAAFGNKEALFRKALDRYLQGTIGVVRDAIDEPTSRGVAERLLRSAADMLTNPRNPRGCLTVVYLMVHNARSRSPRIALTIDL